MDTARPEATSLFSYSFSKLKRIEAQNICVFMLLLLLLLLLTFLCCNANLKLANKIHLLICVKWKIFNLDCGGRIAKIFEAAGIRDGQSSVL